MVGSQCDLAVHGPVLDNLGIILVSSLGTTSEGNLVLAQEPFQVLKLAPGRLVVAQPEQSHVFVVLTEAGFQLPRGFRLEGGLAPFESDAFVADGGAEVRNDGFGDVTPDPDFG